MRWLESSSIRRLDRRPAARRQVVAQLMAGAAFVQAASMSTRDSSRKNAPAIVMRSALLKMKAKNGGYGPDADSAEPRADVLGLAAFVYKTGQSGRLHLSRRKRLARQLLPTRKRRRRRDKESGAAEKLRREKQRAIEDEILGALRSGFQRLDAWGAEASGVFAARHGGQPTGTRQSAACWRIF